MEWTIASVGPVVGFCPVPVVPSHSAFCPAGRSVARERNVANGCVISQSHQEAELELAIRIMSDELSLLAVSPYYHRSQ